MPWCDQRLPSGKAAVCTHAMNESSGPAKSWITCRRKHSPKGNEKVTESQNGPGGKGPQGSRSSNPPHRQGHQPPHVIPAQAAQGPIQPGLEHLQGWMGHPKSLWAVCSKHSSPALLLDSEYTLLVFCMRKKGVGKAPLYLLILLL